MLIPPLPGAAGPPQGVTASRVSVRVRFAETDMMGIVHHANHLVFFEEARVEYLQRRGVSYFDWVARDVHFPVVDARVRYRSAALFYDTIEIDCWIGELSRVAIRFDYLAWRRGSPIAEGYTTLACVNQARTPRRIPTEIIAQITGPEDPGRA